MHMITPVVSYSSEEQYLRASCFAKQNDLQLVLCGQITSGLELRFTSDRLELFDHELDTGLHVDFVGGALAHRVKYGGGKKQALPRAIGLGKLNQPSVLDITAGLGKDAYVLATLGCNITLVEQSAILVELVRDGIVRAQKADEPGSLFHNNFMLIHKDSLDCLQQMEEHDKPDVIFMDPMYPVRDKSALVKKDMQILHKLGLERHDNELLLTLARGIALKRVVVKRPKGAEIISGPQPTTTIESKKTRYDVYVTC